MATLHADDLLAAIRRLPLDERLRLIEKATQEAAQDTPKPGHAAATSAHSLVGLMADEPELVDQMCASVYQCRASAHLRALDE